MYKAVLFDLDGTIAQTMESYFVAWQKACRDFGFEISGSDYYPLEGMKAEELAKTLCRMRGGDTGAVSKIVEQKKNYFIQIFAEARAEIYPGAEELLDTLCANKLKIALVTASVREQVDASIPSGILKKFDTIVTGEMGGRGKPYPDPYLVAAEKLGIDPALCIGVENAPLGVQSVKAAGMYCIGVASTVVPDVLRGADEIVAGFKDIARTNALRSLLTD